MAAITRNPHLRVDTENGDFEMINISKLEQTLAKTQDLAKLPPLPPTPRGAFSPLELRVLPSSSPLQNSGRMDTSKSPKQIKYTIISPALSPSIVELVRNLSLKRKFFT